MYLSHWQSPAQSWQSAPWRLLVVRQLLSCCTHWMLWLSCHIVPEARICRMLILWRAKTLIKYNNNYSILNPRGLLWGYSDATQFPGREHPIVDCMLGPWSNVYIWFLEREECPCKAGMQPRLSIVLSWDCGTADKERCCKDHRDLWVTSSKERPPCWSPGCNPWHSS